MFDFMLFLLYPVRKTTYFLLDRFRFLLQGGSAQSEDEPGGEFPGKV